MANTPKPLDIKAFIDKCIGLYIILYTHSKKAINELGRIQKIEPEIMSYFAVYEIMLFSSIVKIFDIPNISKRNPGEKVYIVYTFADILGQEHAFNSNKSINLDVLREEVTNMLIYLLISS